MNHTRSKLFGTLSFLILSGVLLTAGCSRKGETDELTALKYVPPASKPAAPEAEKEVPRYAYSHASDRDPFVPLIDGDGSGKSLGPRVDLAQNIASLELKGILEDRRGRVAVIMASDGESYFLRSGKIYDRKNRIINGVSGTIKKDSVVISSKNNKTKELPIVRK